MKSYIFSLQATKMIMINQYLTLSQDVLTSISRIRDETIACVQKLAPFVNDMTWAQPLTENLCSEEMKVFEEFPIEYNRKCTYT